MLKSSTVRFAAQAIAQERFDRILQPICKGKKRLGLAISGGVDSMALASLCSKVQTFDMPPVTAFIVDHSLRPGSAAEAKSVSAKLQALGIQSEILVMRWPENSNPAKRPNLETTARKLRFQLLGRACAKFGIDSLLFAHHRDDQAETILSRICAGYLGTGLQGIQASSSIPECHGIYNVSQSGTRRDLDPTKKITKDVVESGGVVVYRPLLDFAKEELIATCQSSQVQWHEDATNADRTLTARNAIRHLLQSNALPSALSPDRLRKLAANKTSQRRSCEATATAMFKAAQVELDTRSSCVVFSLDSRTRDWLSDEVNPQLVAALLTRKFLSLSEDKHKLQLQDVSRAVEYIFPHLFDSRRPISSGVNIGNVTLLKEPIPEESVGRSRDPWKHTIFPRPVRGPEAYEQIHVHAKEKRDPLTSPVWTGAKLFHDRWWIRIKHIPVDLPPRTSIIVRFLKKEELVDMRKEEPNYLVSRLKRHAPQAARFALPAIVERSLVKGTDGSLSTVETVWALPTIDWKRAGFSSWSSLVQGETPWSVTYKNIEFDASENHTTKAAKPFTKSGSTETQP